MPKALATTEAFVATLSGDKEVPPVKLKQQAQQDLANLT